MGKIRITDAKVNKKLIGDEVTYQKVSANKVNPTKGGKSGGRGNGGNKKPKQPSLKDIVLQFIVKQEAFNSEVVSFIKNQEQFNNEQREFNIRIETKVSNLDDKLDNVIKLNNLKS
jgi:hypothetical protein